MTNETPLEYQTKCPPAIKAKITEYANAVRDAALAGASRPKEAGELIAHECYTRYALERTILTALQRARG